MRVVVNISYNVLNTPNKRFLKICSW